MTDLIGSTDFVLAGPALICALLGLLLAAFAMVKIRRKRIFMAGIQGMLATILLSFAAVLVLLGTNLYTYQRLTHETEIARIQFWQSGLQQYLAVILPLEETAGQSYLLSGDEWQIDARILKWHALANLAGLNTRYRLERLSGRYNDIVREQTAPRSVFRLSDDPGLDIWSLLGKLQTWVDWVDTYYGNSAYMPMADGAEYQLVLTQSGIIARPLNDAATRAVQNWK
ncbi:MAG: hypothetical protein WD709_06595 [Gammaproteobacteria bacterium]